MLGPIVIAVLVAHALASAEPSAFQQPAPPTGKATAETTWPPIGVTRLGAGVTAPRLIKEAKPKYRAEAMRAKIQGNVQLEAVVLTDGTVGEVRVTRSLDREFGMDDEAVSCLKTWRFTPGMKDGVAVPVLVEVEMTFSLTKK
jgi:TonB family protein